MLFKESDQLLSKPGKEPLKDTSRFICHQEMKKGNTCSNYPSIKKMRERIAEVKPVWTKYFTPPRDKDKEIKGYGDGNESEEEEEESEEKEE